MEIEGVVVRERGGPAAAERLSLAPPGPGEVLVRLLASGVCHSDLHYKHGWLGDGFPFLLGHEGAGIVEAVGDGVAAVRDAAGGGVDFAFDAVGLPSTLAQCVDALGYKGTAVLIGFPSPDGELRLPLQPWFYGGGTIRVSLNGDLLPARDLPLLAHWYLRGDLDLDRLVSRQVGLGEVEAAFTAMLDGDGLRTVVRLERA